MTANVSSASFWNVKNVLNLDCGDGCMLCTTELYTLNGVDFMVCKMYLNKATRVAQ